ncbi:hypothetical protein EG68_03255 [Paragonimus skrjabini miyazakii]|uniref:Sugar phosphate transporter domain-containing protein n=1 Tax=Paragonimus skrjabini miyazakii TaxID=59628 RepID=A0A8S9Z8R3_9TREM|nr:hypothetical protein EG68_03255 [Paragonimus skrjabini miyazakii]
MSKYSAVFYALTYMVCSTGIVFANKLVLTVHRFPSFMVLALFQTLFTAALIQIFFAGELRKNERTGVFVKVAPLSFCYAIDIVMGIAGTGSLSLPMFSALRRLSNFFILVGEQLFLGVVRVASVYASVCLMVFGAAIAAIGDITFDPVGYTYVFVNNFSTAGKALLTKSRLRDQGFTSIELLYYNSVFTLPFLLVIAWITTDMSQVINYSEWTNPMFLVYFIFSCCSAVLLNYSLLQCTHYTSALTTSIIGVIKNVLVTYAGMFVGGDYVFTPVNFTGVCISATGAVMYVWVMYRQTQVQTKRIEIGVLPQPMINQRTGQDDLVEQNKKTYSTPFLNGTIAARSRMSPRKGE